MPYRTPTLLRKSAYSAQHGLCCYCGTVMWTRNIQAFARAHNISLAQARLLQCTAEHLHPRNDGGDNSPENVAAACWYCNTKRHKRKSPLSPEQYRQHVMNRVKAGAWHCLCGPISVMAA